MALLMKISPRFYSYDIGVMFWIIWF